MLNLSRFLRPMGKYVVLSLVAIFSLVACASDGSPTLPQASQTLKTHILRLLKERNARNVMVTDPGGKSISCADGKAKQTFSATGMDLDNKMSPENIRTALLGALPRVAEYRIVDGKSLERAIVVENKKEGAKLTLDSLRPGVYKVSGETLCLEP
ncbi:hypothetical protein Sru01_37630 [Sphaerisporangium rufum]|uniref:Lipoprotein n=2 Tax=Sphaerisporangium rufum TaxID=1381558 RepID=A0A919R5I6_9ACTN|nr:hypothetical protein Sru01_37630 [Sphaerisporangium rufum]